MKKLLFLLLTGYLSLPLFAQEEKKDEPTDPKKEEKKKVVPQGTESKDRLIFEVTFDNWLEKEDPLKARWNSFGFNFYFMYDLKFKKGSRFSFAPGIGIGTSFVKFNKNLKLTELSTADSTAFVPLPDSVPEYKKNQLTTVFIDVPLELRYRTVPDKHNKSFKLAIGAKVGVLIDSHTKIKTEVDGEVKKFKERPFRDLARFRFGPTFRIGYGPVNVIAFYSVTNLFKNDKGPKINPFSVGISINGL